MCIAFNCSAPAPDGKYCTLHEKHNSSSSGPIKAPKEIPKQTKKTKSINAQLKELYPVFLQKKNFKCEIQSPECTKTATCVHHAKGRGKNEILDQSTWKSSCQKCNSWVESHHAEAVQMGAKVSRHKKKEDG